MNNFTRAHNSYLEPPEEPEAVICEDCGEEMEELVRLNSSDGHDMKCANQYCPGKHEGVAKEMAELLIGAREEVKSLARRIHKLEEKPLRIKNGTTKE